MLNLYKQNKSQLSRTPGVLQYFYNAQFDLSPPLEILDRNIISAKSLIEYEYRLCLD